MLPYLIGTLLMALVAKLAYDQGHVNGENKGRTDVLAEDLKRMEMCDPCDDAQLWHMVNNLYAQVEHSEKEYAKAKEITHG